MTGGDAGHEKELERLSLAYMDRIRALEHARFELERKFDLERQKQYHLLSENEARVAELKAEVAAARATAGELERRIEQALAEREAARKDLLDAHSRLEEQYTLLRDRDREVAEARSALEAAVRATEDTRVRLTREIESERRALADHQRMLAAAEQQCRLVEDSISFELGSALVAGLTSWGGLLRLPRRLRDVGRKASRRRALATDGDVHAGPVKAHLLEATRLESRQGIDAAEAYLRARISAPGELAHALTALAKHVAPRARDDAFRLGRAAHELDPRDYRAKWLAFLHFDAGDIRRAAALLESLPRGYQLRASERHKAHQVLGAARLLERLPDVTAVRSPGTHEAVPGRVLYVAASALPFHVSGYTLRTQALLAALVDAGTDVGCVTRPGYPGDRPDALVDGGGGAWRQGKVEYRSIPAPDRRKVPADVYIDDAADALCRLAAEVRPALIHAASNHENALPALLAARRLGVPFVYEVRGLWEVTAAARQPGWERTERFELERRLETLVATHADRVLTLNSGMADELVARGVPADRIALAPNAVDPDLHRPRPRDETLAGSFGFDADCFVVGYAGSLVGYEGIDDLLRAAAQLAPGHPGLRVLVIGDGEQRTALQGLAQTLGIGDRVRFTGRIVPDAVPSHLALCDCVALPRKPAKVCELVSPIKPLEAMAMGLPLVVSGVRPLRDVVDDGTTGLVHAPADPGSLADAIARLAASPELCRRMGAAARERVLAGNTWQSVAATVASHHRALLSNHVAPIPEGPGVKAVALPAGRNAMTSAEKEAFAGALATAFHQGGPAGVHRLLEAQVRGRNDRFRAFCTLKAAACCLGEGAVDAAVSLAEEAMARNPEAATLKGAARVFFDAGDDARALEVVERLERMQPADETAGRLAGQVRSRLRLFEEARQRRSSADLVPEPRRSVNFLHFSLPYASVGYATRSHGIALGVRAAGWDIRPYTRPGFPVDARPDLAGIALPLRDEIDGIVYGRLLDGGRRGTSEAAYLLAAADRCERVLRRERPAIVHAASNYGTALPALVAARRLGLPFIYEIRGFWEVTRSSRDDAFEKTAKYRAMQLLETLVVEQADHIVTITGAMRDELVARGVPAERITLAYNSVDPARFRAIEPDRALGARLGIPEGVPVIGYVGSFVDYEGLDDLVRAAAILKGEGVEFRLLLVGDGAVMADLTELAVREGVSDRIIATGRVPHEDVESYYSLVDIAPFPRKPWPVCELVSPLKPFEAMAMEKPVVVSATRALLEIVQDGINGLVFEKGSAASLAIALRRLVEDPGLRRDIGRRARQWVEEHRSWERAGRDVVSAYERVAGTR